MTSTPRLSVCSCRAHRPATVQGQHGDPQLFAVPLHRFADLHGQFSVGTNTSAVGPLPWTMRNPLQGAAKAAVFPVPVAACPSNHALPATGNRFPLNRVGFEAQRFKGWSGAGFNPSAANPGENPLAAGSVGDGVVVCFHQEG